MSMVLAFIFPFSFLFVGLCKGIDYVAGLVLCQTTSTDLPTRPPSTRSIPLEHGTHTLSHRVICQRAGIALRSRRTLPSDNIVPSESRYFDFSMVQPGGVKASNSDFVYRRKWPTCRSNSLNSHWCAGDRTTRQPPVRINRLAASISLRSFLMCSSTSMYRTQSKHIFCLKLWSEPTTTRGEASPQVAAAMSWRHRA